MITGDAKEMELPTKMMTQHLNSMLEHLKVSGLIKSRNQSTSSTNTTNNNSTSTATKLEEKCKGVPGKNSSAYINSTSDQVDNSGVILANNVLHVTNHRGVVNDSNCLPTAVGNHCLTATEKATVTTTRTTLNHHHDDNRRQFNSIPIVSKMEVISSGTNVTSMAPNNGTAPMSGLLDVRMVNCSGSATANASGSGQRKQSFVVKPIKLKNVITKAETYDTLYTRGVDVSNICGDLFEL